MLKTGAAISAAIGAGAMLLAGCAEKRSTAIPWATAVQAHPLAPESQTARGGDGGGTAPDLRMEMPAPPSELATRRAGPAKPRVEPVNAEGNTDPAKTPALAPELAPQELELAKQQTNESLNITQRSLQAAKGRRLDSVQTDLVSKITGFADEARQAAKEGDWTRARNLAQKAQVLSQELAGTL